MAKDMNECRFEGRLTRDPETRPVGDSSVTNFGLAVDTSYKQKDGSWKNQAVFTEWQAWNGVGTNFAERCKKGDFVRIKGEFSLDTWEDKESGEKRSAPRFKLVSSFDWRKFDLVKAGTNTDKEEESDSPAPAKKRGRPAKSEAKKVEQPPVDDNNDDDQEIPF